MGVRRRPTLPPPREGSTIGAEGLSFRVRNGTGRFPDAMTAVTVSSFRGDPLPATRLVLVVVGVVPVSREPHSGREAVLLTKQCLVGV